MCNVLMKVLKVLVAFIVATIVIGAVRPIRQPLLAMSHSYLPMGSTVQGAVQLYLTGTILIVCKADYIGCVKNEQIADQAAVHGWDNGVGLLQARMTNWAVTGGRIDNVHKAFSHKEYRAVAHGPNTMRPRDMFILSNMTMLPDGVIPATITPAVLHLDTGSKEHTSRRVMMTEIFTALDRHPTATEFQVPPGLDSNEDGGLYASPWHSDPNVAFHLVGLNLFHMLFGVDVSEHLAALNEYDGLLAPAVLGIFKGEDNAARLAEIRASLEDLVLNAEIGKRYIAAVDADATMGRGEDRLKELLFVAQFAGYAGTGTLTSRTIKHIQTDPAKYIPMFRQNKEAFMLEAARLFPPVAGMNFYVIPEATTRTFGAGITHTAQAGDFGIIHSTGANRDPTFWGDDADEFKPGRPNAQKLMTWNNELDAIRSCPTAAGCPAAPRGCPGTHLALHLATKVTTFVVDAMDGGAAGHGEL